MAGEATVSLAEFRQAQARNSEGDLACPCINSSAYYSTLVNCETQNGQPGVWTYGYQQGGGPGSCYPVTYGGETCSTHDLGVDPLCSGNDPPKYCLDSWCYVDAENCQVSSHLYYRSKLFSSSGLFFSYSTCNSTSGELLDFLTTHELEGKTIKTTIPEIWAPGHYKINESGDLASFSGPEYYDDTIPWNGWIIDYLNAVQKSSNIGNIEYTFRSRGSDIAVPGSKWTAAVHDVQAGISCLSASSFWITSDRLQMTAFTAPTAIDKVYLWVEKPSTSSGSISENIAKVMMPFTTSLWLMLLFTIIGVSILSVFFANQYGDHRLWWAKVRGHEWEKASIFRRSTIFLRVALESIIAYATFFFGHTVDFNVRGSLQQKILNFGFAFLVLIAVAAYTANLAAFLTLSLVDDYVSSLEEAVLKKIPLCAHPAIKADLTQMYPAANFLFNENAPNLYLGMLDWLNAGLCQGLVAGISDIANDLDVMTKYCESGLVSTGSLVLEIPVGFPVCTELSAGISHWMYEAEKKGVTYESFEQENRPDQVCSFQVPKQTSPDELLSLTPANFALPMFVLLLAACVALVVHLYAVKNPGKEHYYVADTSEDMLSKSVINQIRDSPIAYDNFEDDDFEDNPSSQSGVDKPSFGDLEQSTLQRELGRPDSDNILLSLKSDTNFGSTQNQMVLQEVLEAVKGQTELLEKIVAQQEKKEN